MYKMMLLPILLLSVPLACSSGGSSPSKTIDGDGITRTSFYNFDALPATASNAVPGSGGNLEYATDFSTSSVDGWRSTYKYSDGISDSFYRYNNTYNTAHMGFENYGYLEIDSVRKVSGNSLKYTITGGKNDATLPGGNGLPLQNKQQYMDYLAASQNPVEGTIAVGNPYMYFANSSSNTAPTSFEASQGATALTLWMWLPDSWTIGNGGYDKPPKDTLTFGPYSQVMNNEIFPSTHSSYNTNRNIGNHFYHQYHISGGGWVKIYVDSHPVHNNAWHNESLYPYPTKSVRSIGTTYFNNLYRIYFAGNNYQGFTKPLFSVWLDEIEFVNDPEPQNNETINNPSVMFNPSKKSFEIGFTDKYLQCNNNFPNYELRYSYNPITNANWLEAKQAHILARSGFNNVDNVAGRIVKNSTCYRGVWAEYKLRDDDHARLSKGQKIYFAVKDISQINGNGQLPASTGKGRDYTKSPESWDYAADQAALLLIKRFDYTIIEFN